MKMNLVIVALFASASALNVPQKPTQSRRGALQGALSAAAIFALRMPAEARPSDLAMSGLSKEELYAAVAERKEAERIAALPINQIKASREQLAGATALIEGGSWTELRDLITLTTGPKLTEIVKEGKFNNPKVRDLVIDLRKGLFSVDKFAYSQQSFPGADVFAGYCAEGVVPRDAGGCKVKPVYDTKPLFTAVTAALATFDELIATCA